MALERNCAYACVINQPVSLSSCCPQANALLDSLQWVEEASLERSRWEGHACCSREATCIGVCERGRSICSSCIRYLTSVHSSRSACLYASSQDSGVRSQKRTAEVSQASSFSLERGGDNRCGWGWQRFRGGQIQWYSPECRMYRCFSRLCSVRKSVAHIRRTARNKPLVLFACSLP